MISRIIRKIKSILCKRINNGANNIINVECTIKRGKISICGNNNRVDVAGSCQWEDAEIVIHGDNNHVIIESDVRLIGPCRIEIFDNATLIMTQNCGIRGVSISITDGCVEIGERAMFSYGINIRNHDSHRVFNIGDTLPCNPPSDIKIGKHVWICQNVSILKGVEIGDDSVLAFGSVITKSCPSNCIMAGNPAKIVKQGITWDY